MNTSDLRKENLQSSSKFFSIDKNDTKLNWYGMPKHLLGNVAYQKKVKIKVFENGLQFVDENRKYRIQLPPNRTEFDITKFSKHSRLRMLKIMSRVNLKSYVNVYHVTLTYHNNFSSNLSEIKYNFKKFIQFLKYNDFNADYVSRIEFQKRGAPHFHVLFFMKSNLRFRNTEQFRVFLTNFWLKSIKENSIPLQFHSVNVSCAENSAKFFAYVSKYTTKEDEEETKNFKGRRWLCSHNLNLDALEECEISKPTFDKFISKLISYLKTKNRLTFELECNLSESRCCNVFINFEELKLILNDCT